MVEEKRDWNNCAVIVKKLMNLINNYWRGKFDLEIGNRTVFECIRKRKASYFFIMFSLNERNIFACKFISALSRYVIQWWKASSPSCISYVPSSHHPPCFSSHFNHLFSFFIPFNPDTRLQWHCFTLCSKVKCALISWHLFPKCLLLIIYLFLSFFLFLSLRQDISQIIFKTVRIPSS